MDDTTHAGPLTPPHQSLARPQINLKRPLPPKTHPRKPLWRFFRSQLLLSLSALRRLLCRRCGVFIRRRRGSEAEAREAEEGVAEGAEGRGGAVRKEWV